MPVGTVLVIEEVLEVLGDLVFDFQVLDGVLRLLSLAYLFDGVTLQVDFVVQVKDVDFL
jgi:hypothetical protein